MATTEVEDVVEVALDGAGDLGLSVRVNAGGAVVVSKLLALRGYAELVCPTLQAGDVLVAIDGVAVVDLPFSQVMQRLHATVQTRPTRLEFLGVDAFANAQHAVDKWRKATSDDWTEGDRDPADADDAPFREGEFEVAFTSQQPTGLRFAESYIMTSPLRLAHIEPALFVACGERLSREERQAAKQAMRDALLVRVDGDSVLGAPVDDVMALLYDESSFPKTLWLGRAEKLQEDYYVVTLTSREQLKWLCFVPVETMMEVPVVSYAAIGSNTKPVSAMTPRGRRRRRARSDGIREEQYLMSINGFPTLRVGSSSLSSSSSSSFSDSDVINYEDPSIVGVVIKALDEVLLDYPRTLRFRDLRAYRREFLAHEPLSPWQRRRRKKTLEATASIGSTSPTSSDHSDSDYHSSSFASATLSPTSLPATEATAFVHHYPHTFLHIVRARTNAGGSCPHSEGSSYKGLANCEGERSYLRVVPANVKSVVIPDNRRHVGIQLEADGLITQGLPVFKAFVRRDGPARASRRIRVGDRILAVNGVTIDEIPTDVLVRILHGEDMAVGEDLDASTPTHDDRKKLCRSESTSYCRVLRLGRTGMENQINRGSFVGQARRLMAVSAARISLWSPVAKQVNV